MGFSSASAISLSTMPTSIILRQGERTHINLFVKGKHIMHQMLTYLLKKRKSIYQKVNRLLFHPIKHLSLLLGSGVSDLHLAVADNIKPNTIHLTYFSKFSFPTIIRDHGKGIFLNNSKVQSILQT